MTSNMGLKLTSFLDTTQPSEAVAPLAPVAYDDKLWMEASDEEETDTETDAHRCVYLIRFDDINIGYKPSLKSAQRFCKQLMRVCIANSFDGVHKYWWSTKNYKSHLQNHRSYHLKALPFNNLMQRAHVAHTLHIQPIRFLASTSIIDFIGNRVATSQQEEMMKHSSSSSTVVNQLEKLQKWRGGKQSLNTEEEDKKDVSVTNTNESH